MCTEPYNFDNRYVRRKIKDLSLADPRERPRMSQADGRKPAAAVPRAGAAPVIAAVPRPPFRDDCLYQLPDSLIASRLGFANGSDGDQALATVGRAKVLEIRTILDTAVHRTKRVIEDVERARAPKRA